MTHTIDYGKSYGPWIYARECEDCGFFFLGSGVLPCRKCGGEYREVKKVVRRVYTWLEPRFSWWQRVCCFCGFKAERKADLSIERRGGAK